MPTGTVIVRDGLQSVKMQKHQLPIYDREIEIAPLHEDERSGVEHHLIRYPAGLQVKAHRHTSAHTMVVLEGALEANGRVVEAFSYCHFPAGEVMTHKPADGRSCLFVLIFDGPFDVHLVDD